MNTQATTADAYRLVHDGTLAFARAEREGIRIDVEYCQRESRRCQYKIDKTMEKLTKTKLWKRWNYIYGKKTNVFSRTQLSNLLYRHMKITPAKLTNTGEGATDEEALKNLDVPGLIDVLQIHKWNKMKKTYLDAFIELQVDGFIHPSFNLHTVRTYRSSSEDPNFQNIPKRDKESMKICRRAIIPRPGRMLVEADFSSLEVNIGACLHKDPAMISYLTDKKSDMHLDMARQIFKMPNMDRSHPSYNILRQAAKNGFVFPQFYGDYYLNNARSLSDWINLPQGRWKSGQGLRLPDGSYISDHMRSEGIRSFDDFAEYMKQIEDDFWNRRFPVYNKWKQNQVKEYRKKGYLQLVTGFICSGIMRKNEIANYPIQGPAFHCLLKTFIEMDKIIQEEKMKSVLIGQIHDSLIGDIVPEEFPKFEEALHHVVHERLREEWKWIVLPLEIEIEKYGVDKSWVKA